MGHRVEIRVRVSGTNRAEKCCEVIGRQFLGRKANHIVRRKISFDGPFSLRTRWCGGAAAEEDGHAAIVVRFTNVDVGKQHRRLQTLKLQHKVDRTIIVIDAER